MLRPKQLTAIGWSYDRITAWLRGDAAPPGEAIFELKQFFRDTLGDRSFIVELFGDQSEAEAARLHSEIEAMQRRLVEMRAGLKGHGHVAPDQEGVRVGLVEAAAPAGQEVGERLATGERDEAAAADRLAAPTLDGSARS